MLGKSISVRDCDQEELAVFVTVLSPGDVELLAPATILTSANKSSVSVNELILDDTNSVVPVLVVSLVDEDPGAVLSLRDEDTSLSLTPLSVEDELSSAPAIVLRYSVPATIGMNSFLFSRSSNRP